MLDFDGSVLNENDASADHIQLKKALIFVHVIVDMDIFQGGNHKRNHLVISFEAELLIYKDVVEGGLEVFQEVALDDLNFHVLCEDIKVLGIGQELFGAQLKAFEGGVLEFFDF